MAEETRRDDPFTAMLEAQMKLAHGMAQPMIGGTDSPAKLPDPEEMREWAENAGKLQAMWLEFQGNHAVPQAAPELSGDPARWFALMENWTRSLPFAADIEAQQKLWQDSVALWQSVWAGMSGDTVEQPDLPRKDRRFADERWRTQPAFALIHQTYLLLVERIEAMVDDLQGLTPDKREQLKFATRAMADALSPANFAATNPVVLERTMATKGENLVEGMRHLLADLDKGQLTHTDSGAFTLGENIAVTPGKVVHETPLYQLIQYTPTTEKVLAVPLVIFPPWINRFYILDLNPKKSFIRWAVEQGLSVFVVSWKSADASMADIEWDDYIRAQIEVIDHVRDRLKVPAVHAIGYCVAGTTLAATLAILARRGEADRVKSATFFTAQVDFRKAGELLNFVDDQQLAAIENLETDGYLDGRYMAATFNMLRGTDLIWNYVVNNYLLGESYPAFDLLHWNGDVTNLPAKWHRAYLRDLYRDNLLVQPDALSADGTPIDLTRVETPAYIQAGREDHIAPAESVWKIREHFSGPTRFVLAGSGHIAGVVNPPEARKYQYWINEDDGVRTLAQFREGATEHPGSWWPDWIEWIEGHDGEEVAAKGKRVPGKNDADTVIEDAPGRYVMTR
ncbi:class I poly(R)-hydroxyalkanoic acid synthase [Erythrobacter sp. 3-20A1M]|uniref:PHA/PHB synthase family protein n=1 Tax=Erythrobacter sp. 3-20A1M TaxID=2653850 RepID=UPI001BFCC8D5|nr:class I poly(R)-hydroxyalkanoic acid synthase [Erythrobacter sp. 3-20A1M]